jgi:hypothetical protein
MLDVTRNLVLLAGLVGEVLNTCWVGWWKWGLRRGLLVTRARKECVPHNLCLLSRVGNVRIFCGGGVDSRNGWWQGGIDGRWPADVLERLGCGRCSRLNRRAGRRLGKSR